MRILYTAVVISCLCSAAWSASASADVVGTWEGESKCTVADSPCHDEHVVYRIIGDKKHAARFTLAAFKLVNRKAEFMGEIGCEYHADRALLSCTGHTAKQDDWEFQVSQDIMTGTLKIGPEKAVYRRIAVRKELSVEY